MTVKERVRFAPSPTGKLHIGNARTALFNSLFAAHTGGTLVLRIEDTDVERSEPEHELFLIQALKWLNIDWQEGPDRGGPHAPYRQSQRLDLYRAHVQKLLDEGKAFHCYCTDVELEASRKSMLRDGRAPRYSGRCRNLSSQQRQAFESEGRTPCIRYRVPEGGEIRFEDRIHGVMTFRAEEIGDFVLVRSTGLPSYNFAVVVDDHFMEITTVIRGEDHLANTPRQVLLYREFGWEAPRFAHHSLLMGSDRAKLSKRHGVTHVEAFREMGILPEALINYLALLGGSPVVGQDIYTRSELIESFVLEKAGKSSAVFDLQRLLWINLQHFHRQSPRALLGAMAPFLENAGMPVSGRDPGWLEEVAAVLAENIHTLKDVAIHGPIFFKDLPDYDETVRGFLRGDRARRVLGAFLGRLEANPSNDGEVFAALIKEISRELGLSGRELFMPLRGALTGMERGPELDRILPLLSPQVILKRLKAALEA